MIEVHPKEYTLYSSMYGIMFTWVMPALFTLMGIFLIYLSVLRRVENGPPAIFALFFLAAAAWVWWRHLRMPRRIVLHADGRIEFVSPVRRVVLTPHDIVLIKPDNHQFGFLVVKWASGKLTLLNQFNGFHELLTYIEAVNPAVEIRGC